MPAQLSRRHFLRLLGAGTAGLALAACAAPVAAPGAPAAAPAATQAGPVEIEFYHWAAMAVGERLAKEFSAESENIQVKVFPYGTAVGETEEALLTKIAGGLKPDVVSTHVLRTAFFVRSNALVELSEMLDYSAAIEGVRPDYIETYKQIYNGKLYTAPFWTQPTAPVYNKNLVREAGLDPEQSPQTWDELRQWLTALKEKYQYPVHLQDTFKWAPIGFQIEPVMGMLLGETKFPLFKDGKTTLDSEVGIQAFTLFKEFYDQDWVLPSTEYEEPFHRGEVAILWAGNVASAVNRNEQIGGKFEWEHFHGIPTPPNSKFTRPYAQDHGGYVNVIPMVSEHKMEAWEFVKFVMSKKGQEAQVSEGYPTVRTDIDMTAQIDKYPFLKIPLEEWFPYCIFDTPYFYNEVEDLIFKAYQQIMLEKRPIDATLKETAAKINDIWAKGLAA